MAEVSIQHVGDATFKRLKLFRVQCLENGDWRGCVDLETFDEATGSFGQSVLSAKFDRVVLRGKLDNGEWVLLAECNGCTFPAIGWDDDD